jgi:cullin 2
MMEPLMENLVNLLFEGIHYDRLGEASPNITDIVQGVINSFVSVEDFKGKGKLELYQEIFEAPFLQASGEYYKREASKLLQECDVSQYMERVIQETLRSNKVLHPSSFEKVKALCEQHMVVDHMAFLHGECKAVVQEERRKDLSNMYLLLQSVKDGIGTLISELLEHIKAQGLETVRELKGDNVHIQFVESMLSFHKKYKEFIEDVFNGDQSFIGALDKAYASVVNHRPNPKMACRSPEMLAKYCDSLLKKSSKGISESEIDKKLAQSITILKYIDDNDIFQKFYARMLAKRLIHSQSKSMDAEEAMIDRLRQACGYEFTNKLNRMFTDMSVSSDLNNEFNSFLKLVNVNLGISFSIYILQAGAWPLGENSVTPFAVPQELEVSVQMFENFYLNRFRGRKLMWLNHLSQAELKLSYLKKPYQITMHTFQMAILLLFEKTDSLTCKEVQESLQLNSEQFGKHLMSLIESRILLASMETPSPETVLTLNLEYSNKRTKFRITAALQRESPQEVEQTLSSVDEDRKFYLQAVIVRVMKSRKILRDNALIQEVLSESKVAFAPSISMIKKCIEALIDKEYIERTPNSANEYIYLA